MAESMSAPLADMAPAGLISPRSPESAVPPGGPAPGLTHYLVRSELPGVGQELGRAGTGLVLAATYGLALGARGGGWELWRSAFGVPAGLAAVALVGVPSLFVFMALADAPIHPARALGVTARSLGVTGLLLAGLAPAAVLFGVTIERTDVASMMGVLGLLAAGAVGLVHLLNGLSSALRDGSPTARAGGNFALAVFTPFAIAFCIRIWWGLLPMLGGGQ